MSQSQPLPTARTVAASVLVRVWKDRAFAAAALDAEVSRAVQLEPRDRALATELVYGSLRLLPWIDARIEKYATRGLGGVDARTHAEMVLSAYQLFFLERVPAFAAVNEAVEAIKLARGAKLAAFANAVLRKLATDAAATKGPSLLLEAVQASLPDWLRQALIRTLGDDGATAFSAAGIEAPPVGLRVTHEAQVPVLRMMQVGKSAIHQRAHEVQRQRRALVAAQQQLRVGAPGLGREFHAIHQITAIRRQRHAIACFHVG